MAKKVACIEQFINFIIHPEDKENLGVPKYIFYGDGKEYAEKFSFLVKEELLDKYIHYCEKQLAYAKDYKQSLIKPKDFV